MRNGDVESATSGGPATRPTTVQSVERALDILEAMADTGGTSSLTSLAAAADLPLPTTYRLVRTLTARGYVRQDESRDYVLGPRLVRLGEMAGALVGTWAQPRLVELVDRLGESANLALLEGAQVVYMAQAPGRHSMRMFTEVGRRVSPHRTAVGKALLATMPTDRVRDILRRTDLTAHTDNTLTDIDVFEQELGRVRTQGYALDEGEQELGVRCVAVALDGPLPAAISISGPTTRMTDELVEAAVPQLHITADLLVAELAAHTASTNRTRSS